MSLPHTCAVKVGKRGAALLHQLHQMVGTAASEAAAAALTAKQQAAFRSYMQGGVPDMVED